MKKVFKFLWDSIAYLFVLFGLLYIVIMLFWPKEIQDDVNKWLGERWNDCVAIYEKASYNVSENFENLKKMLNIIPKFEGVKIREIDDFEIAEYIDFTVPYDWNVMTATLRDSQKATVVYNDAAMAIMYIHDISINDDAKVLTWYRDELIKSMKEKHPNYTFNAGKVMKNTVALVEVIPEFKQSKMYLAVVRVKDKTIIIEYMYDLDFLKDSEDYFNMIIKEILDSI